MRMWVWWVLVAVGLYGCGGGGGGGRAGGPPLESILFAGNDLPPEQLNREVWRTDGTPEGTQLLVELHPTSGALNSVNTEHLRWSAGRNFFVADDGVHGRELWFSDGTAAGTRLVRDIRPGAAHAGIGTLHLHNGIVYFAANDGETGSELWRSDGTEAGTWRLTGLAPGSCSSLPGSIIEKDNMLYFLARAQCEGNRLPWRLDLSTNTATPLHQTAAYISALRLVGEKLYFIEHRQDDTRLWMWPNEHGESQLVRLAGEGSPAQIQSSLWQLNDTLFFSAYTETHGAELYRADETGQAHLVHDIAPGEESSVPFSFIEIEGWGYFAANDGQGVALWRTDGSSAGTVRIIDSGLIGSGNIFNIQAFQGRLVFNVEQAGSQHLWITDGTPEGSVDLLASQAISSISLFRRVGGWLLFSAADPLHGREMWRTDGTLEGTGLLRDLCPGPCDGY